MSRVAAGIGWLFVGALSLFCCANGVLFVFEVPFTLAFGWIRFLLTVLPQVRINPAGVGFFVITVPLAAWLAHNTCHWLFDDETRRWRWKWTWLGIASVVLMFVAGTAATGVVHQAGWLLTSREPLTVSSWKVHVDREVARCEGQLRQIVQAVSTYAAANGGYVPLDQADLVRVVASEGGQPDWFVCGDGRYGPKPATRSADWVAHVSHGDKHFTYRYFRDPIVGPDGKRRVRMCDRSIHYYGGHMGLVVLYEDGEIESLDRAAATAWLGDGFALEPDFSARTATPSTRQR